MIKVGPDDLLAALEWVHSCLVDTSLSPKERKGVELALEEAIVNVLRHSGSAEKLELRFKNLEKSCVFELKDQGTPFNPLTFSAKEAVAESLEEQEEGGLGILLIRAYIDEMEYRREEPWNVLVLKKNTF